MMGYSKFLGEQVKDLEVVLEEIEKQYASLVDDYMAAAIGRYNRDKEYNDKRNKPN